MITLKMHRKTIYMLCLLSLIVLKSSVAQENLTSDTENIKELLMHQQNAWNEGDIETFMNAYWKNEGLSFIGKNGITKGWSQTLANYKKGYPTREAMGQLSFEILEINQLGANHYLLLGKFALKREKDEPSGYFSLIWRKINGDWKIISDHTSG